MRIDFSPLDRSTVGFDRLFSLMDAMGAGETSQPSYPPYNIERTGENAYRISMAVAGFGEADLALEVKEGVLLVKGEKAAADETKEVLYRGIASRSFDRRFQLADHVVVHGAKLENGPLHIDLVREVPEAMKPRRIQITAPTAAKTIEAAANTAGPSVEAA